MEENKDKKTENSGKLQLKKTFNVGQIKQSFSHGRTRSVSVEIKKKRTLSGLNKDDKQTELQNELNDNQIEVIEENGDDKNLNKKTEKALLEDTPKSNEKAQTDKKTIKKFSTNVNESKSTSVSDKQDKFKNVKHTKVPKSFENRRQGKLTISQALNDDNEKVRSLAAVRRAREKAKLRNLNRLETKETIDNKERRKKEIVIPDVIAVSELASRMAEKSSNLIKILMKLGVMTTINETIDGDTAELLVIELGHTPKE